MKLNNIKGIEYFPIIILTLLTYKIFNNLASVQSIFETIMETIMPLIWGFVFAYLLNPVINSLGKKLNINRGLSMAISYFLLIFIFVLAAMFIAPAISDSIKDIAIKAEQIEEFYSDFSIKYPSFEKYMHSDNNAIGDNVNRIMTMISNLLSNLLVGILDLTSNLFKVFIGLAISVYFLKDKEKFKKGVKKVLYSVFREDVADKICYAGVETNIMFSKYFIGKIIDSIIIGFISFFGMLLIKAPYPVLLAVIIGVTNMIPFFGPIIGAIPSIILTLLVNPMTAVYVAIFVLLLQQFDGYILAPKILGDSVGLSGFWIILAIILGGAVMGVIGMLIAVPITALIRNLIVRFMDYSLIKKNLKKYI